MYSQLAFLVTVIILSTAVLVGCLLTKLSLLSLVAHSRAITADAPTAAPSDASIAIAMLLVTVVLPQGVCLLNALWDSCYLTRRNNPNPSPAAIAYIVLQAALEAVGLISYILIIAPRIGQPTISLLDNAIFFFLAISRFLPFPSAGSGDGGARTRQARGTPSDSMPLLHPRASSPMTGAEPGYQRQRGQKDGTRLSASSHGSFTASFAPPLINGDVEPPAWSCAQSRTAAGLPRLVCLLVQTCALVGIPLYFHLTYHDATAAGMAFVTIFCLSLAWLPALQTRMVEAAAAECSQQQNARCKAAVISGILRLGFTLLAAVVVAQESSHLSVTRLVSSFRSIGSSPLMDTLLMHLVGGFVAYHAARLACTMRIQRPAFALPLITAAPLTLIVVLVECDNLPFNLTAPCLPNDDEAIFVSLSLLLWVSEIGLVFRTIWTNTSPLLALEESLFYQGTYNSVLLDQHLALNRRTPSFETPQHVTAPADDEGAPIRVYICSTMVRSSCMTRVL